MTAEERLALLPQHVIRPGLTRICAACAALGDPQGRYPSFLVAGTNGKGSTCAFLEAALSQLPGPVGLYTSPHLVSFRERIRIGGAPISEQELDLALDKLERAFPEGLEPDGPWALTYFEAATALAFVAFAERGVRAAVLEVGLGGRLDATNLPGARVLVTTITRLGLDHTEWLGDTLAEIAAEKAGIIRSSVPVVVAPSPPAALGPIEAAARRAGAPLVLVGRDATLVPGEGGLSYRGPRWHIDGIRIGLAGGYQAENAAVALATLEAGEAHFGAGPAEARVGLARARWPGRLEVVGQGPLIVLDGAHNPDGARALADSFPHLWPGLAPQVVLGVLGDKDRASILEALLPIAAGVHACAPPSPRAVPPDQLAAEISALGKQARAHDSVAEALSAARAAAGPKGAVLVCGSLFLVGEARRILVGDEPAI